MLLELFEHLRFDLLFGDFTLFIFLERWLTNFVLYAYHTRHLKYVLHCFLCFGSDWVIVFFGSWRLSNGILGIINIHISFTSVRLWVTVWPSAILLFLQALLLFGFIIGRLLRRYDTAATFRSKFIGLELRKLSLFCLLIELLLNKGISVSLKQWALLILDLGSLLEHSEHISIQVQLHILSDLLLLLVQTFSRIIASWVIDYVKRIGPFEIGAPFLTIIEFTQKFFCDINFWCLLLHKSFCSVSGISQEVQKFEGHDPAYSWRVIINIFIFEYSIFCRIRRRRLILKDCQLSTFRAFEALLA